MKLQKNITQKLEIKKFDFSKIEITPAIVMIAKRGSGMLWIIHDVETVQTINDNPNVVTNSTK
jgi:hypothetical protein